MRTTLLLLLAGSVCGAAGGTEAGNDPARRDLSGRWAFRLDPDDAGIDARWAARPLADGGAGDFIPLPGTTDEAGKGAPGPERRGVLTRRHEYIGPAWYQRTVDVPPAWSGKEVDLFLERVLWQSRVWVDGTECGKPLDSWAAPHIHRLGSLDPGKHVVTLRIDNRSIHRLGTYSHSYGPQTQTVWNGVIGRVELRALPALHIETVRVFPRRRAGAWSAAVEVATAGRASGPVSATARIVESGGGRAVAAAATFPVPAGGRAARLLVCGEAPEAWSEFHPRLYDVVVELRAGGKLLQTRRERVGFREIARKGNALLLNGRPLFLRGNLDCVHFPLTGHPSTRKEDWARIFAIYRKHNLNHVRFHSWCPPEAAFRAADETGIYIQAEAGIWINEGKDEGKGPGKGDPGVDAFTQAEMRRIVDTFGNHPSFILMAIGNELGHSNFEVTGGWIEAIKRYDSRRLYAASTARTITPHCDFSATHAVPGIGWVRQHLENGTDWDYETQYRRAPVPIIAHEVGQWPVYPDWSLCGKFRGVLRNTRLEAMREQAQAAGVFEQDRDFTQVSGALNALLYKDEIESFLRTPSCRGFQLLSMQDFQGQGEAYVGWLDMFWDSKGTTDPALFRGYCAPVAALARLPKYTYTAAETISATVVVRNDGPAALEGRRVHWRVRDASGGLRYESALDVPVVQRGAVVEVGSIRLPLAQAGFGSRAIRLVLELRLDGKAEPNTYPLWVYPEKLPAVDTSSIVFSSKVDDRTLGALAGGATVFLDASQLGDPDLQPKLAAWKPLYWSLVFFPGQAETLGLLIQNRHPAFREFPTERFNNWQWWTICRGARGFDLTGRVPADYNPIAQPVPDFHANRKIGSIFEFCVGKGKLLVCGYHLSPERSRQDPAVRQLRYSLLRYVTSRDFAPRQGISPDALRELFPLVETATPAAPPGFERASLYVKPAGRHKELNRHVAYRKELDGVKVARGITYALSGCGGAWADPHCTAWIILRGRDARLTLAPPKASHGELYLQLSDWNHNGRRGRITLEGGRVKARIGAHDQDPTGAWFRFDVLREDTLDRKLTVDLHCAGGPNLMVTGVAFLPTE